MKAAKKDAPETALARLLGTYDPSRGKRMSSEQVRTWADKAWQWLDEMQPQCGTEISAVTTNLRLQVDSIAGLGCKMVKNTERLSQIAASCKLAFKRWQRDEADCEKLKLNRLDSLADVLRRVQDNKTSRACNVGFISFATILGEVAG